VAKRLDGSRCHWYGGRPRPRPHCVRWGPSSPTERGTAARGATTFSKLGVQFLGLGYCTEQNTDGMPSFVHCSLLRNGNHTLHQKSSGGLSKLWGGGPLVVAPLTAAPTFRPTLLWHSHPSQQLLSSCCIITMTNRRLMLMSLKQL